MKRSREGGGHGHPDKLTALERSTIAAMHPLIFVPSLLWPAPVLRDLAPDLDLPALARLLGRGESQSHCHGVHDWLASRFGLGAPLPIAPLRLIGDSGDSGEAGEAHWLCLDPVPVEVQRRSVVLADPNALRLTAEEDAALRTALAPVLLPFGTLCAPQPGRWTLRCDALPPAAAHALPAAIGDALPVPFPAAQAAPAWRAALMDAQMLLAAHPVSLRRRKEGRPTPACLWPWGPGTLTGPLQRPWPTLASDDALLRGLALASGATPLPTPPRYTPEASADFIHLPHAAAAGRDALAWSEALRMLENDWLRPLLAALERGQIAGLTVLAGGRSTCRSWTLTRRTRWRLWRRPASLLALAEEAV